MIKHAALGDMVLVRPFLVTLRRHFPNARLTLSVVENYMNGIPEELVHRVHVSAGKVRPRPPFRHRARRYRELGYHDLLFDLTASPDSYWLTLLNRSGLKIGFRHTPQTRWLYDVAVPRAFMKFEAECYLDLLGILRIPYDWPLDFGRAPGPPYRGRPYLLYFPTASVREKCWPAERYGSLLGRLAEARPEYEHRVLYGVAGWEAAVADAVLASAGERPNVAAVREARGDAFEALVRDATVLIGNDTGVRNLAISHGHAHPGGLSRLPGLHLPAALRAPCGGARPRGPPAGGGRGVRRGGRAAGAHRGRTGVRGGGRGRLRAPGLTPRRGGPARLPPGPCCAPGAGRIPASRPGPGGPAWKGGGRSGAAGPG